MKITTSVNYLTKALYKLSNTFISSKVFVNYIDGKVLLSVYNDADNARYSVCLHEAIIDGHYDCNVAICGRDELNTVLKILSKYWMLTSVIIEFKRVNSSTYTVSFIIGDDVLTIVMSCKSD